MLNINLFRKKTGLLTEEKKETEIKTIFSIKPSNEIVSLPDIQDKTQIDVKYSLIEPYAYAHIFWDKEAHELVYYVEEPSINQEERNILNLLEDGIRELINISFINIKDQQIVIEYLEKNMRVLLNEMHITISDETFLKFMYFIYRDFIGLNEIEPLMQDYFIEDIECNGSKTPLFIVHRKYRNLRTNIIYSDNKVLASFVEKLAQKAGKYVSYSNPLLDAMLPGGSIDYEEPIVYKMKGINRIDKIGELVDKYYNNKESNEPIPINELEVVAFNPSSYKLSWKKADYVYRHKINEDLYNIKLEFGRQIKLTGCHSIFVLRKDGIKSERTENLKIGDYVILPSKIPEAETLKPINLAKELAISDYKNKLVIGNIPYHLYKDKKNILYEYYRRNYKHPNQTYYEHKNKKIIPIALYDLLNIEELKNCFISTTSHHKLPTFLEVNKELMRFLGLYIAEGWLYNYGILFSFNKNETDLIEEIKNSSKKCFNSNIYVEPPEANGIKVRINNLILWLIMKYILKVSTGAKEKRVPEVVFNVSKDLQREFIKAWHLGDYSTTVSKYLANDISYLALINNDIVAFHKTKPKTTIIKGREIKNEGAYYSHFYEREAHNHSSSMIPMEVFNPINKTNFIFSNKRINRKRLYEILNQIRYKRFNNLNIATKKFFLEWERRGFLKDKELTENGKELLQEIEVIKKLLDSDFCFAKIKKMERTKSTTNYVYDISVAGDENFVAGFGGICCHNSRVNATYSTDVTSRGPTFTVRKFSKEPWTPVKLIDFRTVSPEILAYLWLAVEYESNIMIIGGTGSGKTSFLNALAFFIPPAARVVSIEDTKELNLMRENWLPSVAREGTGLANIMGQKHGEVSLFDLLKESFRQRPDYVIVGEIRGKEAYVLFQGMSSGHPSLGTMHAEDVNTMIRRLETEPINLSPSLVESLDVVCVITQTKFGGVDVRRIREIVEIISVKEEKGNIQTNTPFVRDPATDKFYFRTNSYVLDKISKKQGINKNALFREFQLRAKLLWQLYKNKIFSFNEVQEIINDYYKTPQEVLKRFNII